MSVRPTESFLQGMCAITSICSGTLAVSVSVSVFLYFSFEFALLCFALPLSVRSTVDYAELICNGSVIFHIIVNSVLTLPCLQMCFFFFLSVVGLAFLLYPFDPASVNAKLLLRPELEEDFKQPPWKKWIHCY